MSGFKDHFSAGAEDYAAFRPRYPAALFAYLASLPARRVLAWDAATGNGQAAVGLADHFERVMATDASAAQIAHATLHPRVEYRVARAEASGLPGASTDLVSVAQALHWLDVPAFFAEARRVLHPRGAIAIWCYVDPVFEEAAVDAVFQSWYEATVKDHWPPERSITQQGYRSIEFPFREQPVPGFDLVSTPTLAELCGYLRTWSATKRYIAEHGSDPVLEAEAHLREVWGDAGCRHRLLYTTYLRVGRLE